ncbi:MAG: MBL fold metallo-hydrolase [Frankiaceae bacterium]|nr:MBL fold metallo-hydrolase [Frankiaceae bacterium]
MTDRNTDRKAWTEPGAFEVAPGVHRIPLPLPNDGLRAVNVYAVTTDDGVVLIDAGWDIPESRELLGEALGGIGASLGDIRRFLVTHVHRDHYTQAIAVRRQFGSKVGLGIGERPTLELLQSPDRSPLMGQLRHLHVLGAPGLAETIGAFVHGARPDLDQWESPDEWLQPGEIALTGGRVLEAVPTPGHTAGHLVFHDVDAGLLFAGDHVLPTITPSIGFEPVLTAEPLGNFLRSLALMRSRPDALLLPAHGPVAPSVHARVDELIDFHGRRLDEIATATSTGASTAFEVAGVLRWTRRQHKLEDLDPFNAMLAVFETGAHLDLLVTQGRLALTEEDDVRRYA